MRAPELSFRICSEGRCPIQAEFAGFLKVGSQSSGNLVCAFCKHYEQLKKNIKKKKKKGKHNPLPRPGLDSLQIIFVFALNDA